MHAEAIQSRAVEVDRRVRDLAPETAAEIVFEPSGNNGVTWRRNAKSATLTLHDAGRLELTLHPAGEVPDVLEILVDDADAVDMIAVPVANHLR
ncbi:MAG: hypothetical protein QOJ39_2130 [Candidatus Eremiobacteraeota bacterium]|jgi:hypothetical protein|nr:hypothetical protein [Candidatus Eremiobacteraeota bacterium]